MKFLILILPYLIVLIQVIKSNVIILKINGTCSIRFIYSNSRCPNEVYFINGTKIGNNKCEANFKYQENTIMLKWNNPIDTYQLFTGLKNIIEIHFINCTILGNMHEMFLDCSNLKLINFTGIIQVYKEGLDTMYGAFKNCVSLKSLDLSKLILPESDFSYIFDGCYNLEYINFLNYNENKLRSPSFYMKLDNTIPKNLVICINESLSPNFYSYLTNRECTVIYCGEDWRKKQKILIPENNTCKDIEIVQTTEYIINQLTSIIAQEPSHKLDETNNNINSIYSSNALLNTNINEYTDFSSIMNYIIPKVSMIDKKISGYKENIMNGNMDDTLKNVTENKQDFIEKDEEGAIFQITTTENQKNNKNNNISSINFGKCEEELKRIYQINESLPLIIFKIDYYSKDLLIPLVGYEVYHPINKSKLNLSYCENILVGLNIPVSIDENNLFKYEPDSDYYTDNCFSYTTEKGTDIILSDRQQEFKENNLSLCENNCDYSGYDTINKQSLCKCAVKNKIDTISTFLNNHDKLSNNFNDSNIVSGSSNIITIKCTKTLFTKDGLKRNISSYILIFIITFFLISIILFIKFGFLLIKKDIDKIMKDKYNEEKQKMKKNKKSKRVEKNQIKNSLNKKGFKNFPPKKKKSRIILGNKINNKSSNIKEISKFNNLSLNLSNNNNKNTKFKVKKNKNINIINTKDIFKSKINNTSKISYNIFELNLLKYEQARIKDKRNCFNYYLGLIRIKHPIIFAFCPIKDYNSRIIKLDLFF